MLASRLVPPSRRLLALLPALSLLLAAGALPSAGAAERALPEDLTVKDSRTSSPSVDISAIGLEASYFYDSEQTVDVAVPHGFRVGHQLTVWFDVDGDDEPEGHYELKLLPPKKKGGKLLRKVQEFRVGGGWDGPGQLVRCTGSDGFRPVPVEVSGGEKELYLALDLWGCLNHATPPGSGPKGAWRVAVRLAKDGKADMAPNGRRWSPPVLGWAACDPSQDSC